MRMTYHTLSDENMYINDKLSGIMNQCSCENIIGYSVGLCIINSDGDIEYRSYGCGEQELLSTILRNQQEWAQRSGIKSDDEYELENIESMIRIRSDEDIKPKTKSDQEGQKVNL